ncbi:penicillin-binding protein activator [Alisedimentitalea sp. MJ-SS2]|uniref:penicillin-binding protein activator n=1 Tax=Aliisedimentitalea sp. MJ-SS2 TaxID=3049795 RepID=UPI0029156A48|nr:penicillin-binding protein activator [Alisedimentitalea sp. MJ-SS2]MDU8928809.1 penicillin-binding protein activator [Alisedimentitalea sp. MJ-SS2]
MFAVLTPIRKGAARLVAALSLIWLAACEPIALGGGGTSGGPKIDPSAPVPVALLVPRGSSNGSDEFLAKALENAARMAISDLNGVRIDLRVYSTAGTAAQAQSAALQAVNDGAKVILGPVFGEAANAAGVAVARKGVNVLAFSNNPTIAGGNVFVLGPTFDNTAGRLASYAKRQGKGRVLVVYSENVAGQLGKVAIEQAIARQGATLAGSVGYQFSQQGVVSAIPRIKATAAAGQANAVFLTANTAGALPLFAQMLPEAGINPTTTQFIGLSRWDIPPQTLQLPGVQGGWFAMPDPGKTQAFSNRYKAAYGEVPHPIASLGYDGIAAIGALVKAGKSDALTGAALTQGAGFQGATGIFRLRPDGTNQRGLAVAQIRDQQVVVIDPAPQGFGGAGF